MGPISAASDRKPDDLSPSKSHKRRQTEALAVAESANEQIAASSTSNKRLSTSPLEESDISDEDCSGGEDLVHESLQHASSKTKRNPASSKKYTPPDETPSDRDRRTVFVGNLPIEVVQKKVSLDCSRQVAEDRRRSANSELICSPSHVPRRSSPYVFVLFHSHRLPRGSHPMSLRRTKRNERSGRKRGPQLGGCSRKYWRAGINERKKKWIGRRHSSTQRGREKLLSSRRM